MKFKRIILFIAVILLVTACAPGLKVTRLSDPAHNLPQNVIDEIEKAEPTKDVGQQFAQTPFGQWQFVVYNVTHQVSHEFLLRHETSGGIEVKVRGSTERLVYATPQNLPDNSIVDTIFLNTESSRASGFCRIAGRVCIPFEGKRFTLAFNQFYQITPKDWVLKFANASPSEFSPKAQIIDSRFVTKVVFESPRTKTTVFVDEFTKLPVRVLEEGANTKKQYDYYDVKVNTVLAKEVFN